MNRRAKVLACLAGVLLAAGIGLGASPSSAADGSIEKGDFGFLFFTSQPILEVLQFEGDAARTKAAPHLGIGVVYHLLDFLALEPSLYFATSTKEKTDIAGIKTNIDSTLLGGSVGAYYSGRLAGALSFYAGPRLDLINSKVKKRDSTNKKGETVETCFGITGVFGMKYMFNRHVGIFGDLGIGYYSDDAQEKEWDASGTLIGDYRSNISAFSLGRSVLGLCFYLK